MFGAPERDRLPEKTTPHGAADTPSIAALTGQHNGQRRESATTILVSGAEQPRPVCPSTTSSPFGCLTITGLPTLSKTSSRFARHVTALLSKNFGESIQNSSGLAPFSKHRQQSYAESAETNLRRDPPKRGFATSAVQPHALTAVERFTLARQYTERSNTARVSAEMLMWPLIKAPAVKVRR